MRTSLLQFLCQLVIVYVVSCWRLPEKSDYTSHPCKRDCLTSSGQMQCEYNFTVEHYQTLSRACYNCPSNTTDCLRPHCVPGDGSRRAIKVVNRMMPGPAINVCTGDTVVVNVYNELHDFEGTSIHWHGIQQRGTPYMDGVVMVTQCPIPAHSMFQYKFKVEDSGTHYWHAHAGLQRGDGVFGAIIVRDTRPTNNMRLYDFDLPEHTIIVQDWLDEYTASKFSLHHHGIDDNYPASILINGRGKSMKTTERKSLHSMHSMDVMAEDMQMMNMSTTPAITTTDTTVNNTEPGKHNEHINSVPYQVFRVEHWKRYRFRLISNGVLNCPMKVSIEGHNVTLVASDGYDMHPVEVESFIIFAGERYDFVIEANQEIGNYWIHVIGLGDCEGIGLSQSAILRYNGVTEMYPHSGNSYSDGNRQGLTANSMYFTEDNKHLGDLTSDHSTASIYSAHNIRKFYLNMDFNNVESDIFLHRDYYPLSHFTQSLSNAHGTHLYALQINHITNAMPWSPLLSQHGEISEEEFCNETSLTTNCREEFCRCLHRLKVSVGDIVELVLVSEGKNGLGYHPMHLHGYGFHVIGMKKVNSSITREEVEIMDRRGQLKRNLNNPIKKDTVMVPDGGYTVIRFRADNPGFWLFHCHVDFHLSLGMSLVIQVGERHEMPAVPKRFPKCGNWRFVDSEDIPEQSTQCVGSGTICQPTTLVMIILLCLQFTFISNCFAAK